MRRYMATYLYFEIAIRSDPGVGRRKQIHAMHYGLGKFVRNVDSPGSRTCTYVEDVLRDLVLEMKSSADGAGRLQIPVGL